MGVLLLIAVPAVSVIIDNSKEKAFYVSVYNVVKSVVYTNMDVSECKITYNDLKNKIQGGSEIGNIEIYIYSDESGKKAYAVTATSTDSKYRIVTLDFPLENFNINNISNDNDNEYNDLVLRFATMNARTCGI